MTGNGNQPITPFSAACSERFLMNAKFTARSERFMMNAINAKSTACSEHFMMNTKSPHER
jgi:hypothetical protein